MMKMDGRDSAECQNWEKKDINVIFGKFNEVNETKGKYCLLLQKGEDQKLEIKKGGCRGPWLVRFF